MDVRWGLEDPESGGEAQTLGRPGWVNSGGKNLSTSADIASSPSHAQRQDSRGPRAGGPGDGSSLRWSRPDTTARGWTGKGAVESGGTGPQYEAIPAAVCAAVCGCVDVPARGKLRRRQREVSRQYAGTSCISQVRRLQWRGDASRVRGCVHSPRAPDQRDACPRDAQASIPAPPGGARQRACSQ